MLFLFLNFGWLYAALAHTLDRHVTKNDCYNRAYFEIAAMLDGNASLNIKRAVFLAEWAYLDGKRRRFPSQIHSGE